MSSYLLLRNNKESGPFTLEEIKDMSLKAYDLLWVVGKSAAWRYPGEIAELKSFAPAVPEPFTDLFRIRPNAESPGQDTGNTRKSETINTRSGENNIQRRDHSRSVYVNLPAEKKQANNTASPPLSDSFIPPANMQEPQYDFSDLYKKQSSRTIRFSSKLLWAGTILLLFGTGILTGFYISDRRKFFSADANHPQNIPASRPSVRNDIKEISPANSKSGEEQRIHENILVTGDSVKPANPLTKKLTTVGGKKNSKNNHDKKDSVSIPAFVVPVTNLNDSLKQNEVTKTEMLHQKIKAHPETYISLVTGRYTTGIFGGISSFPVTVTNNSSVMMDLVTVNIDYIQNNEKIFKTEHISFNDLEAGETVTIKAPKSPRGVKVSTRIHVIISRQIDLSYSN